MDKLKQRIIDIDTHNLSEDEGKLATALLDVVELCYNHELPWGDTRPIYAGDVLNTIIDALGVEYDDYEPDDDVWVESPDDADYQTVYVWKEIR